MFFVETSDAAMKTSISLNVKKFRKLRGLTQQQLADKATITRNYLTLIENNAREPSMTTLERLSEVLQVPVSVLTLKVDSSSKNPIDKLLYKAYEIATEPC